MGEVLDLTSFYNIFEKNGFNWETFNDIALTLAVKCQNADYNDKLNVREAVQILKILQSNFKNNSGITSALEADNSVHKIRFMRLVVDTTAYYCVLTGDSVSSNFRFTMDTTKKAGIPNAGWEDSIEACIKLLNLLNSDAKESSYEFLKEIEDAYNHNPVYTRFVVKKYCTKKEMEYNLPFVLNTPFYDSLGKYLWHFDMSRLNDFREELKKVWT